MRAVPRELDEQPGGNGHSGLDSMRSWLANGVQLVDRRRRFGGHGNTRKLLVVDPQARSAKSEHWQSTTAALQRHTISGALSELDPEHRRVIQLAYLEGQSNRQIAAVMGVSVTTVKRRLLKALERLEIYISAAGAWLAAVLLAFGAYLATRLARVVGPEDTQRVASAAAAVTLAAVAVGVVTFMPDTATTRHTPATVSKHSPLAQNSPATTIESGGTPTAPTNSTTPTTSTGHKGAGQSDSGPQAGGGGSSANPGSNGCHANPTGAPAPVPVGPRTGHRLGPPVNPPGQGGCKGLQLSSS